MMEHSKRSLEAHKSKEINTVLKTFCDKTRLSAICFFFQGIQKINVFTKHLVKDDLVDGTMRRTKASNINTRNNTGIFLKQCTPITFMYRNKAKPTMMVIA